MDPTPGCSSSTAPDSANSSPRSRPDTSSASGYWDDQHHLLPPAKLLLMCSYGGHIIPRPHDKSLCYVGGDTRIVVVDRHSSLSHLHSRLSQTLLNGRHFTLKYQLPTEDLDSLISLATDEDLDNMIEEYDRTTAAAPAPSPLKPSRLRLFLFPTKPETAASMGSLLDDAKSETWFVDALNGSGLLPRGLSDSAVAIDNLLELDRGMVVNNVSREQQVVVSNSNSKSTDAQEVVLDSPRTSSSFGSSSLTPSIAYLPPIKVRAENYQMGGPDEHLSHLSIAPNAAVPLPNFVANRSGGGENHISRPICDDDQKSDQPPTTGLRKPPLPLQPVQRKLVDIHNLPSPDSKHAGGHNLPSPDSVASDCSSIASAGSLSKHTVYQDATRETRVATDQKIMAMASNTQEQVSVQQQLVVVSVPSVPAFAPASASASHQNQQFIHPSYIHQHPAFPVSSYYPMYLHPQTQQSNQQQTDLLPPPLTHTQTQPCYDPPTVPSSTRPLPLTQPPPPPPPPNNMVPYRESLQPTYTTKAEMAANMYPGGPILVQVPAASQFQQQYIGISQIPQPAHSNAATAYGYDYSHNMQDQVYYGQHMAPTPSAPPPQYHTMTSAAAVMLSQQASSTQQFPPPAPDTTTQQS